MGIDCSSFLLSEKYKPLVAFKTRLVSFAKSKVNILFSSIYSFKRINDDLIN